MVDARRPRRDVPDDDVGIRRSGGTRRVDEITATQGQRLAAEEAGDAGPANRRQHERETNGPRGVQGCDQDE